MDIYVSAASSQQELPHVSSRNFIPWILRCVVFGLGVVVFALADLRIMGNTAAFVLLSLLMVGYLPFEIRLADVRSRAPTWLNPASLASLVVFSFPFGISNFIFFLPDEVTISLGLSREITDAMVWLMALALSGAIAMWIGYDSRFGRLIANSFASSEILKRYVITSFRLNVPAVLFLLAVTIACRFISIYLGIYGYSSNYDRLIEAASYSQYLAMADSLGKLVLLAVALEFYATNVATPRQWALLWIVLVCELLFGLLSGFKSQAAIPFIVLVLCHYAVRRFVPFWMFFAVGLAIVASYAVIEPFRSARFSEADFDGTSVRSIVQTMEKGLRDDSYSDVIGEYAAFTFVMRINSVNDASKGVEYRRQGPPPDPSPNFLGDIFLAPLYALVPRVLWQDKSLGNLGKWYSVEVMGYSESTATSTAMSPITYLNFAGGWTAVVIGFFFVGTLQRGFGDGLRYFGGGGLIILFGLLGTLCAIDSSFNNVVLNIVRLFPLLVVAQMLLLRRRIARGSQ